MYCHHKPAKNKRPTVSLTLTVLGDSCRRRLQHVLRQVDEHLVELASAQQVEVLNDLPRKHTIVNTRRSAVLDL